MSGGECPPPEKGGTKMNPVFWLLVVLLLVLIWFALGPLFKAIGAVFLDLFEGAADGMTEDDNEDNETEDTKQ